MNDQLRLMLSFFLLLWSAINDVLLIACVQCLLVVWLLYRLEGSWNHLKQGWGFLRWLLFPIILLHALFTPGEVLVHPWPFSREGIDYGIWLSVHLVVLLYAGMLVSRLLTLPVIQPWVASFPVTQRLLPLYFKLWPQLWLRMQVTVRTQQQAWLASGRRWRDLPIQLAEVVVSLDHQARLDMKKNTGSKKGRDQFTDRARRPSL